MLASNSGSADVTFVIPSFKSRQTIGRTLQSIFSQRTEARFEVIVVDSSQDSTSHWIECSFPQVRVISTEVRLSPGAARNLGVRRATGRYLAFLDADTAPAPNWLETLLRKMSDTPNIRVISGAVEIGNPEAISARILHWIEFSEFMKAGSSGFRSHLSSSNLLVGKQDFLDAGGFDESFVMAEDLLLSRSFPGALFFESSTSVNHYYRPTWSQAVIHLRRLGYWSGRLRTSVDTKGSWLRSIPLASFGLPPVRCLILVWRIGRKDRSAGLQALFHSPMLLVALFYWAIGFYRGLIETPE